MSKKKTNELVLENKLKSFTITSYGSKLPNILKDAKERFLLEDFINHNFDDNKLNNIE